MELRVCIWLQHGVPQGPLWVQVSAWKRICISPGNYPWHGLVHLSIPGATSGPCSGTAGCSVRKRAQNQALMHCGCSGDEDRGWPGELTRRMVWMCRVHGTALSCSRDQSRQRFQQLRQWKGHMYLPLLSYRLNRAAAQAVVQPILHWDSPPPSPCRNKCDPP